MTATVTVLRETQRSKGQWCPTETGVAIQGLCKQCLDERQLGLLVSHPGCGKTAALQAFCAAYGNARYYRMPSAATPPREMLYSIALNRAGIYFHDPYHVTASSITEAIAEHARDYGPMLIVVDEAQQAFIHKKNRALIHALRDVFDEGRPNVGVVVAGNRELLNELRRPARHNSSGFEHFMGRVGPMLPLERATPSDIQALAEWHPLKPNARPIFIRVAERHGLHKAHILLDVALRNCEAEEADAGHMRDAALALGIGAGS